MTTLYSFIRILSDGDQLTASGFNGWEEARRHIAECHRLYAKPGTGGQQLVALAVISSHKRNDSGKLLDFSCSHYTPSEVAEIAAAWDADQAREKWGVWCQRKESARGLPDRASWLKDCDRVMIFSSEAEARTHAGQLNRSMPHACSYSARRFA